MDRVYEGVPRTCDGCGDPLGRVAAVEVLVDTPAGIKLARTHRGCEQPAVEALVFTNGGGRRLRDSRRSLSA